MREPKQTPFTAAPDGLRVSVRVTPKASRTKVTGLARDAEGHAMLGVAISAPPADGKANAAVITLLAKEWRMAKGAITVASGAGSRRKILHVAGDPGRLLLDLAAWLDDIR